MKLLNKVPAPQKPEPPKHKYYYCLVCNEGAVGPHDPDCNKFIPTPDTAKINQILSERMEADPIIKVSRSIILGTDKVKAARLLIQKRQEEILADIENESKND